MACSFKHCEEFIPVISSIKVLDKKEGAGFLVFLAETGAGQEKPCDGCKELVIPMCMQHCPKSKDLQKLLDEFMAECGRRQEQRTRVESPKGT